MNSSETERRNIVGLERPINIGYDSTAHRSERVDEGRGLNGAVVRLLGD